MKGGPGIDELCDEMENYHEIFVESERAQQFVVARINDDRVSALEYACEELKGVSYFEVGIKLPQAEVSWGKARVSV